MSSLTSLPALLLLPLVPALPLIAAAESAPVPASLPAENPDWSSVQTLLSPPAGGKPFESHTPAERRAFFLANDQQLQRLETAVDVYAALHPDDPRLLDVYVQLSYTAPSYLLGFSSPDDRLPGWDDFIQDEAKLAAFRLRQHARLERVIAHPDVTPNQLGGALYAQFVETRSQFLKTKVETDKSAYLAAADRLFARVPEALTLSGPEHLAFLRTFGPPEALAQFTEKLSASSDPAIRQLLAEARGDFSRFDGIAALAFTAADGSPVDLAKLRGKVVLIDFWATWCGPCVAEIPNVVANYAKYHDKGFEVVGISLENAKLAPADTAEAQAGKLAKARDKMLAFTKDHQMPWPQYFDGKFWKNDHVVRFGIQGIPAMVLLDPEGKVVSIDARGEKLETEIRRLLRL